MCEVSWVFPTPRLGRYLIRTCLDFLIFIFCLCLFWGVVWAHIFVVGLIFFFIAFKNTNNIVKGGKMQFYWNKLLKIIYYIYTISFFENRGGVGALPPRSKNSFVSECRETQKPLKWVEVRWERTKTTQTPTLAL